jgi:hypothetical protein
MTETEHIIRALEAFSRGEQPDRLSIKLLHEREYLAISITMQLR